MASDAKEEERKARFNQWAAVVNQLCKDKSPTFLLYMREFILPWMKKAGSAHLRFALRDECAGRAVDLLLKLDDVIVVKQGDDVITLGLSPL
jgi:hypothetical protein